MLHAGFFISKNLTVSPFMKTRIAFFSASLLFISLHSFAQNDLYAQDGLQFSQSSVNGTARVQGLGGTQLSLGADMSNLSGNPAGLGFFRKSEFSITGGLGYYNTSSDYLNTQSTDGKLNVHIPNFGIVFSGVKDDIVGGKWRGGSFGISFNRTNSFQNTFTYQGLNTKDSFLDFLVKQANGVNARDLTYRTTDNGDYEASYQLPADIARLTAAYVVFLVNPALIPDPRKYPNPNAQDVPAKDLINTTNYYRFNSGFNGFGESLSNLFFYSNQRGTVSTRGASNQWNISYGGNYNNRFYFGTNLGITRLRNVVSSTYREDFVPTPKTNDSDRLINGFTYAEDKTRTGTGVNLKLGFIYRITDAFRVGLTAVTPTVYSLKETVMYTFTASYPQGTEINSYSYEKGAIDSLTRPYNFTSAYTNNGQFFPAPKSSTVPYDFSYTLLTPAQFSGGLSYFFGKSGFVSADVDYVPYKWMRFNNSVIGSDVNRIIKNQFDNVINARIGAELRADIFRIRGGFAFYQDPTPNNNVDDTRLSFSLGGGIRQNNFYFDLAAVHTRYKSAYLPYDLQGLNAASIQNTPTTLIFTFGSYF
jgi:hypothetical protein